MGVLLASSAWRPSTPKRASLRDRGGGKAAFAGMTRRAALAAALALATYLVTAWPIASVAVGGATFVLPVLLLREDRTHLDRLEAVASWTEMLRDTLAGSAGLAQAVHATAAAPPASLQTPVRTLAARLATGVDAPEAFRLFADELSDPSADVVAVVLALASRERTERLGDLLGALAASTREEARQRHEVEASRAAARSAARSITIFSLGFFVVLSLTAREYLAPYSSPLGQLVLAVALALFAGGLWIMSRMLRHRDATRLFVGKASR
jgi:tight adherence protein B